MENTYMQDKKQICLTLPEELFKTLKKVAEENFLPLNALIRTAIINYLREYNKNEN